MQPKKIDCTEKNLHTFIDKAAVSAGWTAPRRRHLPSVGLYNNFGFCVGRGRRLVAVCRSLLSYACLLRSQAPSRRSRHRKPSSASPQSPLNFVPCRGTGHPPAPLRLASAKSHACIFCSFVNALTTKMLRYQLFAGRGRRLLASGLALLAHTLVAVAPRK